MTEKDTRTAKRAGDGPPTLDAVVAVNVLSDLKFCITDCKLYVPVVTLQAEYENKLYEEIKTGFSVVVTWNKYRSQMSNQPTTNNFNYLTDATFNNVDILFVLAFKNEEVRSSFEKYYAPTVKMKDYNVIVDIQQPLK